MTSFNKTFLKPRLSSSSNDEVDDLLTRYFRTQVPRTWPPCPTPASEIATLQLPRKRTAGRLSRLTRRLAVAAAVAGLVVGYHGLQSSFVEPQSPLPLRISGPEMSFRFDSPKVLDDTKKDEQGEGAKKKQIP
jgi:hypothetical protein